MTELLDRLIRQQAISQQLAIEQPKNSIPQQAVDGTADSIAIMLQA
jgi:hypothetical protein